MCSLFYFNFLLLLTRTTQSSLTVSNCVYILREFTHVISCKLPLFQRTFDLFLSDDAVVFVS